MLKRSLAVLTLVVAAASVAFAQNANTSTQPAMRAQEETGSQEASSNSTRPRQRRNRGGDATSASTKGVAAAFNALLDGIRRADVNAVTGIYWNSPQLILFNNNG